MPKNVLWIMADQLRWDYLSCYGATHIETPNIDWLAQQGMRFDKAYVQSPICGPSRMSFYTGRYVRSHGATWNGFPLRVGEPTLGEHLRDAGARCDLVGKTHMTPDADGMRRLGLSPETIIGARVAQCGFDEVVRDDGTNHSDYPGRASDYDAYLREHGMDGENPWEEWANTGIAPDGSMRSGWAMENAALAARVPKEHSETAWLTTRGIEYIEEQGDQPWLCHLSYIKPHWPYLAPAPYNDKYGPGDLPPINRGNAERLTDHPLMRAWMDMRVNKTFSRTEVRDIVAPVYMGLIKELDDQLGRLFAYLRDTGRMEDTMVVFCSDHGDNMGDHWMGEKDLFFDCSAKIPLILYDPRKAADATRGTASDALVEGIDLVPTFMEFMGAGEKPEIVEGRSLTPLLHGHATKLRDFAVSEYDYSTRGARKTVGVDQNDARLVMIFDGRWKYIHVEHMRPLLFDLQTDPNELSDLGNDPTFADQIDRMKELHFAWARQHHNRITRTAAAVNMMADRGEPPGIYIGFHEEKDVLAEGMKLPAHTTN